ncbi:MAG: hypothetical protein DRP42_01420, partial [Tenericutes bacterium]
GGGSLGAAAVDEVANAVTQVNDKILVLNDKIDSNVQLLTGKIDAGVTVNNVTEQVDTIVAQAVAAVETKLNNKIDMNGNETTSELRLIESRIGRNENTLDYRLTEVERLAKESLNHALS